ncbi:M4 family metallopeptidase [Pontimicrobium sp. MEBiC01747]
MKLKKRYITLGMLFLLSLTIYAQENAEHKKIFIELNEEGESFSNIMEVLKSKFDVSDNNSLLNTKTFNDSYGFKHKEYQQYYSNIKVEHSVLKMHLKNEAMVSVTGEFVSNLSLDTKPQISEPDAFKKALGYVNAETYIWDDSEMYQWYLSENNSQVGELVICKNFLSENEINQYELAYKFDIYSLVPLSRAHIYVSATTGEIIHTNSIIKHANKHKANIPKKPTPFVTGTASTRYSGSRSIETTLASGSYILKDATRGNGIETYDLNNGTSYGSAINFSDNNNNWTTSEWHNSQKDDAALDAHWGAEMTYDYFLNEHSRNSFDNSGAIIKSYIHYSSNYVNAFWNGSVMTYGDGNASIDPLTSIDIAAHEIGHAVCTHTANLTYSYESGALNESYSDIWGACVEFFADPTKSTWELGEDINFVIRSLSNPNAHNQPDTYLGTYWYTGSGDHGGVHTNSGVNNFWFYLLSQGGSGTNDNSDFYSVTGIGITKAAKIAYRTESVYLSASSNYNDAKNFSIQAAADLYGVGSMEWNSVKAAWCAVGVGVCCPSDLTITANVSSASTDNQEAVNSITASNTIASGANAVYHAGNEVLLTSDFDALNGSQFRAHIEGCTGNFVLKQGASEEETETKEELVLNDDTINSLKVYPNPTKGIINIKLKSSLLDNATINVYSFNGAQVYTNTIQRKNVSNHELDLSKFQAGIYIIKVTDSKGTTHINKVIKE